jgi:hypothetical protein
MHFDTSFALSSELNYCRGGIGANSSSSTNMNLADSILSLGFFVPLDQITSNMCQVSFEEQEQVNSSFSNKASSIRKWEASIRTVRERVQYFTNMYSDTSFALFSELNKTKSKSKNIYYGLQNRQ